MNLTSVMRYFVKLEYIFASILVALFYLLVGEFDWWWLIVLFPLFDISLVGYMMNPRVGAITYNIVHSFAGPAILACVYVVTVGHTAADEARVFTSDSLLLFTILVWIFHICVDRALGFGMKHVEGAGYTHLGKVGKTAKKKV